MAEEVVKNGDAQNASWKAVVTFSAMKPQLFMEAPKANNAVQFYKAAFGAEEINRVTHPKRKADQDLPLVISAELKLGSTTFLVSDLYDDSSALIKTVGPGGVFCLETEDVEAAVANAVKAGAVSDGEIVEGDGLKGEVKDPYGNVWLICSTAKKTADVES